MNARRLITFIVVFSALAFGTWWMFQQNDAAEEEAEVETEVTVEVGTITRATLHRSINIYGVVEPEHASAGNPAALAMLTAPSAGLVYKVLCIEGQAVKKGEVLLKLDTRAAEAKVTEADKALEFAIQQSDRQKALLKVEGTAVKSVQEAEAAVEKARLDVASAQNALTLLQIEAPISGIATEVAVREGESVEPGKSVIMVLDPTRLTFRGQVPAEQLDEIKPGQPVEFMVAGKEAQTSAKVLLVNPGLDVQSGTAEVLASVPPDSGLHSGAWVQVRILVEEHKDCLAVPEASVVEGEGGSAISIVEGDTATQHPVKTSLRDGGLVEVKAPDIKEGDKVVTVGAYGLPKATKIIVEPAEPQAHEH
jgi:membrane fusion protein (multidrug efflux system)